MKRKVSFAAALFALPICCDAMTALSDPGSYCNRHSAFGKLSYKFITEGSTNVVAEAIVSAIFDDDGRTLRVPDDVDEFIEKYAPPANKIGIKGAVHDFIATLNRPAIDEEPDFNVGDEALDLYSCGAEVLGDVTGNDSD